MLVVVLLPSVSAPLGHAEVVLLHSDLLRWAMLGWCFYHQFLLRWAMPGQRLLAAGRASAVLLHGTTQLRNEGRAQ